MEKKWWHEAVGYQIYPRSFQDSNGDGIGDIRGVIDRLDYLQELGIDFVWLCPMYKSPLDDNGYDISDYQDILEDFGTMADFDALLQEMHDRGMKLIIDLVLNHTSDEHPWFIESKSSKDNPKRDWYIWRDGKDGEEPNNWESIFGGSAWEYDEKTDQYFLHVFSRRQPDLNWENTEVRTALYDTVNWWLDKGIDGFRIDAISHIKKRPGFPDMPNPDGKKYVSSFDMHMNQKGIHTYLQEFKDETYGKYEHALSVGEANGVSVDEANLWVGKEGKMDMIFQFEHIDLWDYESETGLDVINVKQALTRWQKGLENDGWNALYIENHDKPRIVSSWGNDKEYWRESATALGAMYFFMKGTPFIYQGQEIGMTNAYFDSIEDYDDVAAKNLYHEKKEEGLSDKEILHILGNTSRDNSRTPMQWSNEENAGFSSGKPWMKVNSNYQTVNVEQQRENKDSVFHFYKKMIQLKKEHQIFTYGSYDLLMEDHEQVFAYQRRLDGKTALVMVNISNQEAIWIAENGMSVSSNNLILTNIATTLKENSTEITLKPYEARVYLMNV
ncbi:glycoside hydrolase family 13 protein [Lederbergia lenta]|uniref:Alpha-amylase n=1 Tax=Lederbergia lenta TaxID=1467 RepID=A0A2X4W1R6_LEDLE|nr:alpha-glucosidase [Lederbergia lenta]MCM3112686.1 alpha-glucosidase [Lederbergia lenta]MEC2323725.1 alpha-glucosidase [Lederbergia lenta]SQI51560.1 alpha amylase catalytic domain-containing protein [Lederbergia lenta]